MPSEGSHERLRDVTCHVGIHLGARPIAEASIFMLTLQDVRDSVFHISLKLFLGGEVLWEELSGELGEAAKEQHL